MEEKACNVDQFDDIVMACGRFAILFCPVHGVPTGWLYFPSECFVFCSGGTTAGLALASYLSTLKARVRGLT